VNETISLPKAMALGTKVQLKNGVFRDVKTRQWVFSGVEKGKKEKRATILSAIRLAPASIASKSRGGKEILILLGSEKFNKMFTIQSPI
jgi:hypothetical protein